MNIYFCQSKQPLEKSHQRELSLKLLDHALEAELGVKSGDFKILRNKYGKPYFADSDIHFNYSHCKYGTACAVCHSPVGIDIQEIKTVRPSVIKRVCCACELDLIKTDEDFIRIWAQKEAYAKFTGKGLAEGFKSIDTTKLFGSCVFKCGEIYIACHSENLEEADIVHVNYSQIIEKFFSKFNN